ncbi:unnamed protein product, partial [Peniophora sp. CBMAI 1063]
MRPLPFFEDPSGFAHWGSPRKLSIGRPSHPMPATEKVKNAVKVVGELLQTRTTGRGHGKRDGEEASDVLLRANSGLARVVLQAELRGLDPTRAELVSLARSGCGLLREVCADEWELFGAFFKGKAGRAAMYTYLEGLCDHLYDDLRPRILHESRLSALAEVCAVLRALMVLDAPAPGTDQSDSDEDSEELSISDADGTKAKKDKGLGPPPVAALLAAVLQDAQTRLFFRAQAAIQSEIRGFVPKDSDLAYPAILLAGNIADLASEALALTRASLTPAASHLPPLDGALFRARHLLILKEIARGLDLGLGAIPASSSSSTAPPLSRSVSTSLPPTMSYGTVTPTNNDGGLAETFSNLLGER